MSPFPKFARMYLETVDHSRFLNWLEEHFIEGQYMGRAHHVYIDKASYLAMAKRELGERGDSFVYICCICEDDVAQIILRWDAIEA